MNLTDVPFVGAMFALDGRDSVFDALMVLGPTLILTVVIFGRSPVTTALTAAYVLTLPLYVVYKAASKRPE